MTRVLAYFRKQVECDEEIEIDTPADDISMHSVEQALRAAYPFDEVEVDDYEVLSDEVAS